MIIIVCAAKGEPRICQQRPYRDSRRGKCSHSIIRRSVEKVEIDCRVVSPDKSLVAMLRLCYVRTRLIDVGYRGWRRWKVRRPGCAVIVLVVDLATGGLSVRSGPRYPDPTITVLYRCRRLVVHAGRCQLDWACRWKLCPPSGPVEPVIALSRACPAGGLGVVHHCVDFLS